MSNLMYGPIFEQLNTQFGDKSISDGNSYDGAYVTAESYDTDATEAAVTVAEDYYAADHTGDFQHDMLYNSTALNGRTYEEALAHELHIKLKHIAIKSFVSLYTREEMVQMLNLLGKGSLYYPDDIRIRIGRADTLSLTDIAYAWNKVHEDEKPINYCPKDELP